MPNVRFIEVGRNKLSWEAECKSEVTESWLYGQARKALHSSNITFGENGTIFAGMYSVGKFEIVTEEA